MDQKTIWQSRTFWFNALTLIVLLSTQFADVGQYGPEITKWAGVVLTVGNIGLRFITNQGVTLK